jgi:hypothetical protein
MSRPHVGPIGCTYAAVERHAVHDGAHREFSNAVIHLSAVWLKRPHGRGTFQQDTSVVSQVG